MFSPSPSNQIVTQACIEGAVKYSYKEYDEYMARRKCLIDCVKHILGFKTSMSIKVFLTVAKLPENDT